MRKILKILIITLLSILTSLFLYMFIGYLVMAVKRPIIYGPNGTTFFAGMYLMSATALILFVISLSILITTVIMINKKRTK